MPDHRATPAVASGAVRNTSATFESIRQAGDNVIIELTATAAYIGMFEGTSTIRAR
jgi:hypothetical protein